jgi:hypothetical protein
MEMRLQDRLEKARDYHLRDPIRDRGNTQRTRSAIAFGNLDTTYWRRVSTPARYSPLSPVRIPHSFWLAGELEVRNFLWNCSPR